MRKILLFVVASAVAFLHSYTYGQCTRIISSAAGADNYNGDGGAATAAALYSPTRLCIDGSGNIYISEIGNLRIRKISPSGIITTLAGTGADGYSGDGGPATAATVNPGGIAIDGGGNVYFADNTNNRVRKISAAGIISTVAGNGIGGYSGDGGAATAAQLNYPTDVAIDGSGNLFIADGNNHTIRKVATSGTITTVAGNGIFGFSGDGGAATAARLYYPTGVAVDGIGNIFITDGNNHRVRKVAVSGIITTVAGTGVAGYSGDGGLATAATLDYPTELVVDGSGNLLIADMVNDRIRKVSAAGIITTVAGTFASAYGAEGVAATATGINATSITVDLGGNMYIAEQLNNRVRKVSAAGIINTIAGGYFGEGGSAAAAILLQPTGVAIDNAGNMFLSEESRKRVRKVSVSGVITTVAGNGGDGFSGDGVAATASAVRPGYIATDGSGNLYVTDQSRIRKITPAGIISTVAGNGTYGFGGDGGPATAAQVYFLGGVAADGSGNIYFSDYYNYRIRKVSAAGIISTVVGNGTNGYSGDGGPATSAAISIVNGIAIDGAGNLYFADRNNACIRKVSATGIISTVAGNGLAGFSGDGGPATAAQLNNPQGIALDGSGNIYVADAGNFRIRMISTSGIITSAAGNGTVGNSGNGGPATAAQLFFPMGVAADASGNIYFADENKIRKIGIGYPVLSTLSGPGQVCAGSSVSLTDTAAGGSWSSTLPLVASVSNTGIVTGIGEGTATISYTLSNSCGSTTVTRVVTVSLLAPMAGAIGGPGMVCTGAAITLTDTMAGGTWSSTDTAIASVSGMGVVVGAAAGAAIISYTVTNGCGSASASESVTVNPVLVAGAISGPSSLCVGTTASLYNTTPGGVWSVTPATVATIAADGLAGGGAAGSATVSYTLTNDCGTDVATYPINIITSPAAITLSGPASVCAGATISLTSTISGGNWSSTDTAIASVSGMGVVVGAAAGAAIISYTVTNGCGSASASESVTVNPVLVAGAISGPSSLCVGTTASLYNTTPGGVWSVTPATVATIAADGLAGGGSAGSATVSYTLTNDCGTDIATYPINIITSPAAITLSGPASVCAGATISLTSTISGGNWSSTDTAIATVTGAGVVGGAAPGTATISYTVSNICGAALASQGIIVNPSVTPSVAFTFTPADTICEGTPVTFTAMAVNGGTAPAFTWTSSGVPVGTGNPFTYAPGTGNSITVVLTSSAVCAVPASVSAPDTSIVVHPALIPDIHIASSVPGNEISYLGQLVTFVASVTDGGSAPSFQWYLNGVAVPGATSVTYATNVASPDTVYCIMTSSLECVTSNIDTGNTVVITTGTLGINNPSLHAGITISPNPNSGIFTISGRMPGSTPVELYVIDMLGKTIFTTTVNPVNYILSQEIQVGNNTPPGNYLLRIIGGTEVQVIQFTISN